MDQGVICSLKAQYRKNVVREIIRSAERKKLSKTFFMLPATQMLFPAWYAVTTKTVLNSFQKLKVLSEKPES